VGFLSSSTLPQESGGSPTIYNVSLGPVSTEQSQALPANTKQFMVKSRGQSLLQIAFSSGQSGTNYITIQPNAVFSTSGLFASQTVYFQSPQTGDVVEIMAIT
jgi:hypothetical protein